VDDSVVTSGLGSRSFLDLVLRLTPSSTLTNRCLVGKHGERSLYKRYCPERPRGLSCDQRRVSFLYWLLITPTSLSPSPPTAPG